MKIRIIFVLITGLFFVTACEKLQEIFTTVSGKVYTNSCKVVLAVKGDGDLLDYLNEIDSLDNQSLGDPDYFRGFDIVIGSDSLYSITMFSFGSTYIVAINDDGYLKNKLDTLDHIGFYGELDTVTIDTLNIDTFFVFSKPGMINVESGVDQSNIDVENTIQFRWFKIIWQMLP
jgi:hypothetical protein